MILKMIPNKSSLFNKIPTFLVENKKFSLNFALAFEKMFFLPGSRSGIRIGKKIPGSGSVKNESGSATLWQENLKLTDDDVGGFAPELGGNALEAGLLPNLGGGVDVLHGEDGPQAEQEDLGERRHQLHVIYLSIN